MTFAPDAARTRTISAAEPALIVAMTSGNAAEIARFFSSELQVPDGLNPDSHSATREVGERHFFYLDYFYGVR